MKHLIIFTVFVNLIIVAQAQSLDYMNQEDYRAIFNVSYGEFERNKFDIILPTLESKHGLAIFIHGGGFVDGDKKDYYKRKDDIKYFIENNIAVATINYRYRNSDDSIGVKLCLQDIKRAIQFMRFNAAEYNIDKTRIGCYGGSAGAGSSLYFAFHDDMAIEGDPSILGQSTRIKCAGAIATQATYNVFRWRKVVPGLWIGLILKRKFFYDVAANFYGYPNYKSFKKQKKEISESLDMLDMIDDEDPPVYLMNLMEETFPANDNIIQHHREHAIAVSKKLNKHGVKNYLFTSKHVDAESDIQPTIKEFMVQHLK